MEDSFWDSGYKLLDNKGNEWDLGPMLGLDVWAGLPGDNPRARGFLRFDEKGPHINDHGIETRLSPGYVLTPVNGNIINNLRCKFELIYNK